MKHSYLSILLALLFCLICNNSLAYDIAVKNADGVTIYYNWINNQTELEVTYRSYSNHTYYGYKDLTSLSIPESVTYSGKNYSVTSIGDYAFYGCSGLTSVTIPSSVTSIGYYAFEGCSGLTSVTIPSSVTSIGDGAFWGCSGLTSVTIPSSVTSIGDDAFYGCSGLTSVTIPSSVTSIGDRAFYGCSGLTSVTIPSSVTSIGYYAFYGCSGMSSVTIPNSVTSIGYYAFYGCSGLTSVTIPNSVTSIGNYAFYNCSGLKSITIPNSVTSIGSYAFSGTYIKSLTIGTGVLEIGSGAFNKSYLGKTIWLTNTPPTGYTYAEGGINYVANNLYTSLSNQKVYPFLSSIFEVDGVKYVPISPSDRTCDVIDCNYDESVTNLHINSTVSYKGVNMTVKDINPYSFYNNNNTKEVIVNCDGLIGDYAFAECSSLETCTLGEKVTKIDDSAFKNCSKLQKIVIPDLVDLIGTSAFSGCTTLNNLKIGNQVEQINTYAFSNCSALPLIVIPPSVSSIGDYSFQGCSNLSTVIIADRTNELNLGSNGSSPLFSSCPLDSVYIGGNITFETSSSYGYSPFYRNTSLRIIHITDKETEISENEFYGCEALRIAKVCINGMIGDNAFAECSSLETCTLGEKVTKINNSAFKNCSKLQKIVIPDLVDLIGTSAFSGCTTLNNLKIGNQVEQINTYAFSNCSALPLIVIPPSVSSIGDYSFKGCSNLSTVIIADRTNELNLGSNGSSPLFSSCPLDTVYIGGNISYKTSSSYGYSPFYRNTSLRTIHITDKETEISENEFYGCTKLKNVRIGDGVTTIGNWAFSGCSSLDYFAFGDKVETIGQEAFSDCVNLTKIISRASTPPTCKSQALDDINKWNCELKVPLGSLTAYQNANQWKEFFFISEDTNVNKINVTGISLTPTEYTLAGIGSQIQLTVTILPENATDKTVVWACSDESVCKVDDGNVMAIGVGSATITATTVDGGYSAQCTVTVKNNNPETKEGDANEDGSIDISDVLLLVDMILGKESVSPQRMTNGDVNKDGTIDISDVLMVVDIILGKVTLLETFVVNGVEFNMVKVAGGTFQMGATAEQGSDYDSDEFPVHQVTLSDYYIGETEVTQELWEAVMGSNPSYFSGSDQLPVECVSWDDCQEFITKLNQLTGQNFRLPTEAEWEFAARGGNASKGYKYAGSDNIDNVAWYWKNSSDKTHVVGTRSPNELGLYDMSGNVYEWCQDWSGDYSSGSQTNPSGPSSGSRRVWRGGSFFENARSCLVSGRSDNFPSSRSSDGGFRLAQ